MKIFDDSCNNLNCNYSFFSFETVLLCATACYRNVLVGKPICYQRNSLYNTVSITSSCRVLNIKNTVHSGKALQLTMCMLD